MADTRSATELRMAEILRWQMLGKTIEEIGSYLGIAADSVSALVRHPRYAELRSDYVKDVYADVDLTVKTRAADAMLKEAAPDAAEALIEILHSKRQEVIVTEKGPQVIETALDPTDKRLAATAILDRAGYGPLQRKAIHKRVELDPVSAQLMREALADARPPTLDAEVVEDEDDA